MNRSGRSVEIDEAEVAQCFLLSSLALTLAKTTYSKAAKAELSKNFDTAFRLYIKSAEIFLHLSRASDDNERDKAKWKSRAAQALERAEKIKAVTKKSSDQASAAQSDAQPSVTHTLTPVGVDHFSHRS